MTAISTWPYHVRRELDPDAVLDYTIDWSDWLVTGESIIGTDWTVTGASVIRSGYTATTSTVWISGATGTTVQATCEITTDSSPTARVDQRTLVIQVQER